MSFLHKHQKLEKNSLLLLFWTTHCKIEQN